MQITIDEMGTSKVAIVESQDIILGDVQGALDLMATIQYTYGTDKLLIRKAHVAEDFFDLSTRLAGDILQKYTNYNVKLAIVGDFEVYGSKSLRDFIYESNKGQRIFFLSDDQAALQALHRIE